MQSTGLTQSQSVTEEFAAYLPSIRRRWQAHRAAGQRRQAEAWVAARQAADLLRRRFSAKEVLAFGSLVHPGRFTERSDIDLAVSGIPAAQFFKAWAEVAFSCPFALDLVDLADCPPALQDLIRREGVPL